MAKLTVTQLENCPYIPAGWWWDGPPGYYEFGGPGTFMEYYGKPMKLGSGDDLVVGMLGQLKDASIDGGKGYDIFQVNFTPEQVFGATMVTDWWWDGELETEGYYTIDSTYLLNSSLKNFEEIDFNGTPFFLLNNDAPQLGRGIDNFYGLDIDEDFTVDASLLTIKKLGALANNDDATFVNLAASNQIIAKMGVLPTFLGETLPFTLEEPLDSIELNLQAAREIRRDINPYGDNEHLAFGNFVDKGIVKLEVQKDVYATVTPNVAWGYESDYQQLILSGAGHVAVANVEDDRFFDFRETSSERVRPIEGNDNIVIDGRALTGGLYVQNDPFVTENMSFSTKANSIDSTNLVGSTISHMDVIATSGKGDYIDISGDYWAPSWDNYGDIDAYLPDAGTAVRIKPTGNLASQFAQADAYSAANNTIVWFVGVDRNTYVWDDGTPSAPAAPGGPAEQPGIYDDFVIKIVGSHILGFDAENGHLIL